MEENPLIAIILLFFVLAYGLIISYIDELEQQEELERQELERKRLEQERAQQEYIKAIELSNKWANVMVNR